MPAPRPAAQRLPFLDALRVIAFGLLVPYHVGMYYVSWDWHLKSPQAGPAHPPQGQHTAQASRRHRQQRHPLHRGQTGLGEAPQQGHQHRHHGAGGEPTAVVGVLDRHQSGLLGDAQAFFTHEDPQADRRPHHGVDEQDHQHRVQQGTPLDRGHGSTSGQL